MNDILSQISIPGDLGSQIDIETVLSCMEQGAKENTITSFKNGIHISVDDSFEILYQNGKIIQTPSFVSSCNQSFLITDKLVGFIERDQTSLDDFPALERFKIGEKIFSPVYFCENDSDTYELVVFPMTGESEESFYCHITDIDQIPIRLNQQMNQWKHEIKKGLKI